LILDDYDQLDEGIGSGNGGTLPKSSLLSEYRQQAGSGNSGARLACFQSGRTADQAARSYLFRGPGVQHEHTQAPAAEAAHWFQPSGRLQKGVRSKKRGTLGSAWEIGYRSITPLVCGLWQTRANSQKIFIQSTAGDV